MTASDGRFECLPRLLFLPPPGHGYAACSYPTWPTGFPDREDYDLFGSTPVEVAPLFWYRWVAGHQISFILWRTIGDVLERHPDRTPTRRELDTMTACVDGYSAMLLYSATVPRDHYHAQLRARMALQHPSFSGTWASDYRPLRRLFRGKLPWQRDPSCAPLQEAVARNQEIHDHIADHLVPDGRSLLQHAGGAGAGISREKEDLFDNFFLTIRRPVSHAEVLAQLSSRVGELTADLQHNGLYPDVGGAHLPVLPSASSEAIRSMASAVLRLVRRAALLTAGLGRPLEAVRR